MGAYKVQAYPKAGTESDESQSVPSPEKLFKTRDLELPFFEGSPRIVGCTPWDTPVPFYTRTCPY